jgi:hypothetical protein
LNHTGIKAGDVAQFHFSTLSFEGAFSNFVSKVDPKTNKKAESQSLEIL